MKRKISLIIAASIAAASLGAQSSVTPAGGTPASGTLSSAVVQRLTLGDAIRLGARNSASSQSARARVDEAQARVVQNRSALLPNLSASGFQIARTTNTASFGFSFPTTPGQPPLFDPNGQIIPPFWNIDYRGRVSQTLFDFSAIARVREARSAVTFASAQATVASEQAGSQAALAYVRALRAEDDFRAVGADSVLASDLAGVAQAQLKAGTGVLLDVTRARAQLASTRARLIAARAARDRSRIDLARALNIPVGTQIALADSLADADTASFSTDSSVATDRALRTRPDLIAAQARIAAAQQSVSAIRAERLPSVSFIGDDGVNGKSYGHLLNTYEYGFQLSVPILDGFRREGRVQEQQGIVREAQIQQRDIQQQAAADVSSAILDLHSAAEQLVATREGLTLAESEVSQARERFRAGVAGNADVITALLQLTTARTSVIDSETNYQNARIALARAQGAVTTLP